MILADTSVWVDHLRSTDRHLSDLLDRNVVLSHPWVLGEIVLGGLREDSPVAQLMLRLPKAAVATEAEVLGLISRERLAGRDIGGIGYVDAQLLAATRLTPDAALWTRDRKLAGLAEVLGVAYRA